MAAKMAAALSLTWKHLLSSLGWFVRTTAEDPRVALPVRLLPGRGDCPAPPSPPPPTHTFFWFPSFRWPLTHPERVFFYDETQSGVTLSVSCTDLTAVQLVAPRARVRWQG